MTAIGRVVEAKELHQNRLVVAPLLKRPGSRHSVVDHARSIPGTPTLSRCRAPIAG